MERRVLLLASVWCAAFPLVGLWARLHWFADGSLFSYAVAAGQGWEYHWRQIPGRVAAFLYATAPAQLLGGEAGVWLYAALWFAAPALSLALAWRLDRDGHIRPWAALSSALLLPFLFGFPTELWISHAAFWPALALLWRAAPAPVSAAALGVTALSHEAGLVWAVFAAALAVLSPAPGAWRRAALALAPALLAWFAMKTLVVPDPYVAEVMARVARSFADPSNLAPPVVLLALGGLAAFAAGLALRRGVGVALGLAAAALALAWLLLDVPVHGWARYFVRSLVFLLVPALALLAALRARAWLPCCESWAAPALGALAVVTLVHAVELARFVALWRPYVASVGALAMSDESDPALGDAAFVSAARLPPRFAPMGWHSTTPFLSVLAAPGLAPRRLVVDPAVGYWWFDCAGASRPTALPAETAALVRRYACRYRP